jgi:hypothetical protein
MVRLKGVVVKLVFVARKATVQKAFPHSYAFLASKLSIAKVILDFDYHQKKKKKREKKEKT